MWRENERKVKFSVAEEAVVFQPPSSEKATTLLIGLN
jgi:hypothetical protein